jgi:hypothetical protein
VATAMYMRWDGVTVEQYEAARERVDWEGDSPDGALFHVAAFEDGGIRVFDLWESGEQFQAFVESRLMPGVKEVGIEGEPDVTLLEVHRTWAPQPIESGVNALA